MATDNTCAHFVSRDKRWVYQVSVEAVLPRYARYNARTARAVVNLVPVEGSSHSQAVVGGAPAAMLALI